MDKTCILYDYINETFKNYEWYHNNIDEIMSAIEDYVCEKCSEDIDFMKGFLRGFTIDCEDEDSLGLYFRIVNPYIETELKLLKILQKKGIPFGTDIKHKNLISEIPGLKSIGDLNTINNIPNIESDNNVKKYI